jgi:hypothetical protein
MMKLPDHLNTRPQMDEAVDAADCAIDHEMIAEGYLRNPDVFGHDEGTMKAIAHALTSIAYSLRMMNGDI